MELGGNSLPSGPDGVKRKVSYFYDPEIGSYYYGENHVMKPHRIRMTHDLLSKYKLLPLMDVYAPTKAETEQLTMFHDVTYIKHLSTITPEIAVDKKEVLDGFGLSVVRGADCPVFDDLYSYCQSYAGGSINCATMLNRKDCDIAINWSGGLHHAKKCGASGFCYVNDIVLAILELLKQHDRVLYIDIDVHHGDGVEEAFFTTDRVMTVSFHKYHNFFPGTGNINDIGHDKGKYYSVNVPLDDGIDDHTYTTLFKKILGKVMEVYKPGAVVLQCGADSLSRDKLGPFNLSTKGHAECVKYMRSFNVPLLLLGGGGYKISSVARCWCYETAVAIGVEVDDKLPQHDYSAYYEPDDTLHVAACSNIKNKNKREVLEYLEQEILKNLSELQCAPSVQFQERPPDTHLPDADEEDDDERYDPAESDMDVEQDDYDTMSDECENPNLQGESSKLEAEDQKEVAVYEKGWTSGIPDLNVAYDKFL